MKRHWFLLALVFGCAQGATAGEVEDLLTRVRAGQAELRNWELEIPAVQAEREFTIRGKTDKSTFATFHHERSTLVALGTRRYCLTPNEAFVVEKTPASGQYALVFQSANKPEELFHTTAGKSHLLFRPLTAAVQSSTVLGVLDRAGFKAESVTRGEAGLVTLRYSRPLPGQGEGGVDRGALTFSTDNHYLLTRFEYELITKAGDTSSLYRGVVTRKFTSRNGRPVVTEVSQVLSSTPAATSDNTTKVRYTYPAQGASPDEFRLEHYLPPPPVLDVYKDRPPFNWRLWGGIGVSCIALSVLLTWWVRRKRSQA
ncbi:hypothetical protein GobsT_01270 [Gemmata obscuriglobus]|uniref:DUF1583 domain-containing protein n=1 Tax=Gemmata obscuriglobus TaxID=114 RepID=A0A2Z3HHH3_9BACT|nr:hypothetical protein [Gemmata obscuriglobus]AWM41254.1 hypothetical protein C1280_32515 [Gemmata obscuriglobus]QEG25401.1 hypothetical protein GobsT_01270 [Gemmata obscuriglobus]VTR98468.1 unnamed protein product [Gemmata obscuriglobus UQM 2246]